MLNPKARLKSYYEKCVNGMINGNISLETRAYVQAKLDADMMDDYMRECGVTSPDEVDYNNPVVAVAHLLHDPLYRHYIMHGTDKQKQKVYDLMTPEMLDVYWNYEDNGARFCDMEDKKKRKQDKKRHKAGVRSGTK